MADAAHRLVLGTAQLGMAYGVANESGMPDQATADALLRLAHEERVCWLDTARAYGRSEAVIGDFLTRNPDVRFQIVSKIEPALADAGAERVIAAVRESNARLAGQLSVVLLHDADMLAHWTKGLGEALNQCVADGLIERIGVSVYSPAQFEAALDTDGITAIQAPFNVFDRTLLERGLLSRANDKGIALYLRSIFLQGLLLMAPDAVPPNLEFAEPALRTWRALCHRLTRSADELALHYALRATKDTHLVVGCETTAQLARNLAALGSHPLDDDGLSQIGTLPLGDEKLVRPYQWGVA